MSCYTQKVIPNTSTVESSIEFEIETDRNLYFDMLDNHLSVKLQVFKGRLFDAFKRERAEHKAIYEEDSDEERKLYLAFGNNLLGSLFSNCYFFFKRNGYNTD